MDRGDRKKRAPPLIVVWRLGAVENEQDGQLWATVLRSDWDTTDELLRRGGAEDTRVPLIVDTVNLVPDSVTTNEWEPIS